MLADQRTRRVSGATETGATTHMSNTEPTGTPTTTETPPAASFTQQQVDAAAARARSEGRQAAEKHLAEQLGVTLDEAKTLIASAKAKADADKTEAQKAIEAANAARAAAEAEKTAAAAERHAGRVERALLAAGAPAAALAALRVDVPVGADDQTLTAAVEALKTSLPAVFTPATAGTPAPTPGAPPAPAKPPVGGQQIPDGLAKGEALWKERHPARPNAA